MEILGARELRLALERELVTLYQHPERLVDVEEPTQVEESDLVDRLYAISTRTPLENGE